MVAGNLGSRLVTGLLVGCALFTTGLVARRELASDRVPAPPADRPVDGWTELITRGYRAQDTDSTAPVMLVFTDFQCPACRQFHQSTVRAALGGLREAVTVQYRHWPLSYHSNALPAAIAAECAGAQGRFYEFADSLFAHQADLAQLDFRSVGKTAGVGDVEEFEACLAAESTRDVVLEDQRTAEALGSLGTPTILLDGILLGSVPDSIALANRLRLLRQ